MCGGGPQVLYVPYADFVASIIMYYVAMKKFHVIIIATATFSEMLASNHVYSV